MSGVREACNRLEALPFPLEFMQETILKEELPRRGDPPCFERENWCPFEDEAINLLLEARFTGAMIASHFFTRSKAAAGQRIGQVGTKIHGHDKASSMCIIPRPLDGLHVGAMKLIDKLEEKLRRKTLFGKLVRTAKSNASGDTTKPHYIQTKRLVVPLRWLVCERYIHERERKAVLKYVREAAPSAPCVKAMLAEASTGGTKAELKFSSDLSALLQEEDCDMQYEHADASKDYCQFGLTLTSNCRPTLVWQVPAAKAISSSSDVANLLNETSRMRDRFGWTDGTDELSLSASDVLRLVLQKEQHEKSVKDFGCVYRCPSEQEMLPSGRLPKKGTLQVLRGGIVHAGPDDTKKRSLLFGTVTIEGLEEYNTDFQTRTDIELYNITKSAWSDVGVDDRRLLLWNLVFAMREFTAKAGLPESADSLTFPTRPCPVELSDFIVAVETLYRTEGDVTEEEKTSEARELITDLAAIPVLTFVAGAAGRT
jgi:hypothetical protein